MNFHLNYQLQNVYIFVKISREGINKSAKHYGNRLIGMISFKISIFALLNTADQEVYFSSIEKI